MKHQWKKQFSLVLCLCMFGCSGSLHEHTIADLQKSGRLWVRWKPNQIQVMGSVPSPQHDVFPVIFATVLSREPSSNVLGEAPPAPSDWGYTAYKTRLSLPIPWLWLYPRKNFDIHIILSSWMKQGQSTLLLHCVVPVQLLPHRSFLLTIKKRCKRRWFEAKGLLPQEQARRLIQWLRQKRPNHRVHRVTRL